MPKRSKQVKKTDRTKAWHKRKPKPPKLGIRKQNPTILIVCEGQTEECYFESFPVLSLTVTTVNLGGQSKLQLVEAAMELKKEQEYDSVWCVFDMDINRGEKEFADFDNAIEKAQSQNMEVAYSNDAFELWFYLHYHFTDQEHRRDFYYQELGKLWGCSYEREGKKRRFCDQIYSKLLDSETANQEDAIKYAEKLFDRQENEPPHKQNPVTLVHKLVSSLNENLRP
ncbi:MAG: RloB family protein [Bacteroidota bacterium]